MRMGPIKQTECIQRIAPGSEYIYRNTAKMKPSLSRAALITLALLLTGCQGIIAVLEPSTVTVFLVNDAAFPVDVLVYIHDNQNVSEDTLIQSGDVIDVTLQPGEIVSFDEDCDDLQAITLDAELRVLGAIGPTVATDVLRDGSDFYCGDTITYTFDHSDLIIDFQVTTEIE